MAYSACTFGIAMFAVFLTTPFSGASYLPSEGLLNEMPKNCSGLEFCLVKHDKYPQEKINKLLTEKYQLTLGSVHDEPVYRSGPNDDEQTDCEKRITYGEIYEIIDEYDNVRIVVQSPNLFQQQIRIEQCTNPGRLLLEGGTEHFGSEELKINTINCVQKMMDYSFLVLTRDGNEVESVRSKHGIPVCCSCRVEMPAN